MTGAFKGDYRFVTRSQAGPGRPVSDPERSWALTVKQPLASLLIDGVETILTKSLPPPVELIGRDIFLHAGQGHVAYKHFSPLQETRATRHFGASLQTLRNGEDDAGTGRAVQGALLGFSRLVAAYVISNTINGRVYASLHDADTRRALGVWRDYDGAACPPGDVSARRWAWCFDSPTRFRVPEPMIGAGYLYDLEKHRDRIAREAARVASLEAGALEQQRRTS